MNVKAIILVTTLMSSVLASITYAETTIECYFKIPKEVVVKGQEYSAVKTVKPWDKDIIQTLIIYQSGLIAFNTYSISDEDMNEYGGIQRNDYNFDYRWGSPYYKSCDQAYESRTKVDPKQEGPRFTDFKSYTFVTCLNTPRRITISLPENYDVYRDGYAQEVFEGTLTIKHAEKNIFSQYPLIGKVAMECEKIEGGE